MAKPSMAIPPAASAPAASAPAAKPPAASPPEISVRGRISEAEATAVLGLVRAATEEDGVAPLS